MYRLQVMILAQQKDTLYLGFFFPLPPFFHDLDGAILTLAQLERLRSEMVAALACEHERALVLWQHHEGRAKLSYAAGEWILRLGAISTVAAREQLEDLAENIGRYLDDNVVTEANASEAMLALRERYQSEAG